MRPGVIVTLNDEVVLLKRGIEPGMGKWVFPGGYVDRGEKLEAAAAREAMEEVGLEVEIQDLLGVFSYENVPTIPGCIRGRSGRRQIEGELRDAGGADLRSGPDSLVRTCHFAVRSRRFESGRHGMRSTAVQSVGPWAEKGEIRVGC